jgi:hypothetical protein
MHVHSYLGFFLKVKCVDLFELAFLCAGRRWLSMGRDHDHSNSDPDVRLTNEKKNLALPVVRCVPDAAAATVSFWAPNVGVVKSNLISCRQDDAPGQFL